MHHFDESSGSDRFVAVCRDFWRQASPLHRSAISGSLGLIALLITADWLWQDFRRTLDQHALTASAVASAAMVLVAALFFDALLEYSTRRRALYAAQHEAKRWRPFERIVLDEAFSIARRYQQTSRILPLTEELAWEQDPGNEEAIAERDLQVEEWTAPGGKGVPANTWTGPNAKESFEEELVATREAAVTPGATVTRWAALLDALPENKRLLQQLMSVLQSQQRQIEQMLDGSSEPSLDALISSSRSVMNEIHAYVQAYAKRTDRSEESVWGSLVWRPTTVIKKPNWRTPF